MTGAGAGAEQARPVEVRSYPAKALGARPAVRPNTLDDPVLAELYSRGWRTWHD